MNKCKENINVCLISKKGHKWPFFLIMLGALIALPVRVWLSLPLFNSISLLDVVSICLLIYLVLRAAQNQKLNVGDRWVFAALVVPLGMLIISLVWTTDAASTVKQFIIFAEALTCYLATISLIRTRSYWRYDVVIIVIWAFIATILSCAFLSLLHVPGFEPRLPPGLANKPAQLTNYFNSYYSRLSNPFIGLSNDFASILVLFVFPLYAIAVYKDTFVARAIAHLNLLAIFMTQSRGALGAIAICGFIYFFKNISKGKSWKILAAILMISMIGLLLYFMMNQNSAEFLSTRLGSVNIESRLAGYRDLVALILQRPLLGYGGGVVPTDNPIVTIGIHNAYLEQALYYGIIGGSLTSLFILLIPLRFWIIHYHHSGSARLFAGAATLSVLAETIIYVSETSYQASVIRVLIYFSLALIIMLTQLKMTVIKK